jgi:hypothetical protein
MILIIFRSPVHFKQEDVFLAGARVFVAGILQKQRRK